MSEPVNSPCFFQRKNVSSAAPHRAAVVLRAPRGNALPLRERRTDLCGGSRRAAWRRGSILGVAPVM